MASLQAHLAVWIIKWRVKRKLRGVRDYHLARKILRPDPYKVPSSVCISPAQLNGISGEGIEGPLSTNGVLLYLHGGGLFRVFRRNSPTDHGILCAERIPRLRAKLPPRS